MNIIKKVTITLAVLMFIITGVNKALATTGTITTETVRVREEASTDSNILARGKLGEQVEILGEEGDWYKVSYNDQEGYIYKEYLEPNEETTDDATSETTAEEKSEEENTVEENEQENIETEVSTVIGNKTTQTTTGYLIPSFSSIKIIEIEPNKEIELIETIANWSKIKLDDNTVWIPNIALMQTVEADTETSEEEQSKEETEVEATEEETTDESEVTEINQSGYISSTSNAYFRSGPDTTYDSLGKLAPNTVITVISEENDWYKVSYNGQEGYVSKSLVTIGTPTETEEEMTEEASSRSSDESRTTTESTSSSQIVETAQKYYGYKYVSGGASPSTGFDCSGFTQYVYGQCGISLARTAASQASYGTAISKDELQPGDLLLFHYYGSSSIGHVGIYIGNGQFIHAANSTRGVVYDTINSGYYYENYAGARRF